jgi:hypothetical protein
MLSELPLSFFVWFVIRRIHGLKCQHELPVFTRSLNLIVSTQANHPSAELRQLAHVRQWNSDSWISY